MEELHIATTIQHATNSLEQTVLQDLDKQDEIPAESQSPIKCHGISPWLDYQQPLNTLYKKSHQLPQQRTETVLREVSTVHHRRLTVVDRLCKPVIRKSKRYACENINSYKLNKTQIDASHELCGTSPIYITSIRCSSIRDRSLLPFIPAKMKNAGITLIVALNNESTLFYCKRVNSTRRCKRSSFYANSSFGGELKLGRIETPMDMYKTHSIFKLQRSIGHNNASLLS